MSNEQKSGRGRVYTLAEKLRAVAQAEREGTSAAARALGASDSTTMGSWRSRGMGGAKAATPIAPAPVAATRPVGLVAP